MDPVDQDLTRAVLVVRQIATLPAALAKTFWIVAAELKPYCNTAYLQWVCARLLPCQPRSVHRPIQECVALRGVVGDWRAVGMTPPAENRSAQSVSVARLSNLLQQSACMTSSVHGQHPLPTGFLFRVCDMMHAEGWGTHWRSTQYSPTLNLSAVAVSFRYSPTYPAAKTLQEATNGKGQGRVSICQGGLTVTYAMHAA